MNKNKTVVVSVELLEWAQQNIDCIEDEAERQKVSAELGKYIAAAPAATAQPDEREDAESIIKDIRELTDLADKMGRSRGQNNYCMNRTALDKFVDLKIALEARIRAALTAPQDAQERDVIKELADRFAAIPHEMWQAIEVANLLREYITTAQPSDKPEGKAEQQAEPVAFTAQDRLDRLKQYPYRAETMWSKDLCDGGDIPLYTHPPAQQQLTDEAADKARNALLWFYRRAKPKYGRLPFAEEAIALLTNRPTDKDAGDRS